MENILASHILKEEDAPLFPLPQAWLSYCREPSDPETKARREGAYSLLAKLLTFSEIPALPLHFTEFGKPYFAIEDTDEAGLPPLYFSLSHEGSYGAAIVSTVPVGIDLCRIEPLNEHHLRLSARYDIDDSSPESFAYGWAEREAVAKCLPNSRGLADMDMDPEDFGIEVDVFAAKDQVTGEEYALAVARQSLYDEDELDTDGEDGFDIFRLPRN